MKYPYIKFPSSNPAYKWVSRPYVPIKIIGPRGIWEGYGLIDSGADKSLFNVDVAEDIGLDLADVRLENFGGIEGGTLSARIARVKLQVVGIKEIINLEAGFVESQAVGVILGQDGFFDNFRIKFERDHGIVEITPVT